MADSMTIPDIPDEAIEAAARVTATHLGGVPLRLHPDRARDVIESAWPHLYAAALRHAADNLTGCGPEHCGGCACSGVEDELRGMADGVVS